MKPILTRTSANNWARSLALAGALLLMAPLNTIAVPDAVHDPHRLSGAGEFQDTIENRCTICHTRDRVDAAIGQGENLDDLLQRMIERGAILNERDKSVLGTFWGSPVSGDPDPLKDAQ